MKVNLFKILKQLSIESKETFPFSEQRHHTTFVISILLSKVTERFDDSLYLLSQDEINS